MVHGNGEEMGESPLRLAQILRPTNVVFLPNILFSKWLPVNAYSYIFWQCHITSHSTTPHTMNRAR